MAGLPPCAFWDFSLALYARPGVAEACLRLQQRLGIDVNMLFLALWLAHEEGQPLSAGEFAALIARAAPLQDDVVRALRTARTALKAMLAGEAEALRPAIGALRTAVKRNELEAEHLEQVLLASWRPHRRGPAAGHAVRPALAAANADAYLAALGARSEAADRADLELILDAVFSGKSQASHELGRGGGD